MNGAREAHGVVRFRTVRIVVLLAIALSSVPPMARAHSARPDRPASRDWPLTLTRTVHGAQLRALGATIVPDPRQQLQQAPNDCALAVVDELQRAAARPIPNRAWLARSLTLGPAGVPLDSLAPTLRRLGWAARTMRGEPSLESQPLSPPAIALMHPGHFVLLTQRTPDQVVYFDPLVGLVHQPRLAFEARWTGKSVQLSTPDD